jgi:hypothetical protein
MRHYGIFVRVLRRADHESEFADRRVASERFRARASTHSPPTRTRNDGRRASHDVRLRLLGEPPIAAHSFAAHAGGVHAGPGGRPRIHSQYARARDERGVGMDGSLRRTASRAGARACRLSLVHWGRFTVSITAGRSRYSYARWGTRPATSTCWPITSAAHSLARRADCGTIAPRVR